jgi:hypothetical protein
LIRRGFTPISTISISELREVATRTSTASLKRCPVEASALGVLPTAAVSVHLFVDNTG